MNSIIQKNNVEAYSTTKSTIKCKYCDKKHEGGINSVQSEENCLN